MNRPEADRDQVVVARDMTIDERKEHLTLMAWVEARRKGETVEGETTLVEKDEPTGEELLLDE